MKDDTRFSPWLSLQAAAPLVERSVGGDKNDATDFLIKAAAGITEAAAKIEKTVPDILANQLNSSLANVSAARKAIAKIVEPTLKRVTAATDYAHAAIETLIAKTDLTAPTDVMLAMQHQEVRAALLRMSDVERRKALAHAISAGDETFVAAATGGSPTLSGMTAHEQTMARERWRSTRHPETAAHIARLRNGLAQLARVAPMLKKWSDQIVPEPDKATVAAAEHSAEKATRVAS